MPRKIVIKDRFDEQNATQMALQDLPENFFSLFHLASESLLYGDLKIKKFFDAVLEDYQSSSHTMDELSHFIAEISVYYEKLITPTLFNCFKSAYHAENASPAFLFLQKLGKLKLVTIESFVALEKIVLPEKYLKTPVKDFFSHVIPEEGSSPFEDEPKTPNQGTSKIRP